MALLLRACHCLNGQPFCTGALKRLGVRARRLAAEFEDMIKRRRADAQAAGRVDFVRPASGPDLTRLPTGGDVAAQLAANAKLAASAKAQAAGAARRASKWDAGRR